VNADMRNEFIAKPKHNSPGRTPWGAN
jgi:hypothetical protein